jgi:excisionase family DNA binding protein
MNEADLATSFAIFAAKQRGAEEVTPDHILLGCLRAISRFGIAALGPWSLDLEALGIDWVRQPDGPRPKVAYSQAAVDLFDRAAHIAKSAGETGVGVNHLLAAFATEENGLMGELKRGHGITSASWRAAIARLGDDESNGAARPDHVERGKKSPREYLTPEEAADALGIHVQTMRAYIRSGRLPAFRLAGERAIRILRADLEKVLEPLPGEKKEE